MVLMSAQVWAMPCVSQVVVVSREQTLTELVFQAAPVYDFRLLIVACTQLGLHLQCLHTVYALTVFALKMFMIQSYS